MVRTQVQLTAEQSRALRRLASARGVPVALLIREGVDLLVGSSRTADDTDRRRRALAAAGRFRSSLGNLAQEHDRHLADAYAQ